MDENLTLPDFLRNIADEEGRDAVVVDMRKQFLTDLPNSLRDQFENAPVGSKAEAVIHSFDAVTGKMLHWFAGLLHDAGFKVETDGVVELDANLEPIDEDFREPLPRA